MKFGALVLIAVLLLAPKEGESVPKIVDDGKVDFGWPNFFSPQIAILRKGEEKQGIDIEGKNGDTVSDHRLKTSQENEGNQDEIDDLIDYTLKGGLRGTLILLNSTDLNDVQEEAKEAVMAAQAHNAKAMNRKDEITEEGVRLRTPIIEKTLLPAFGKYGSMITYHKGEETMKLIYYGNWCGKGGRSAPVDNLDRCCLEHDKCYGRLVRQCPDVWKRPYQMMYGWAVVEDDTVCIRSESSCVNQVCECDRRANSCFEKYLSNLPHEVVRELSANKTEELVETNYENK